MKRILLASAAGLIGAMLLAVSAAATDGEMIVSVDTTLTEDHNGNIVIDTDGVTLDCDGFDVLGTNTGIGIDVVDRTGVAIYDCNVADFPTGLHIANSSDMEVVGVSVTGAVDAYVVEDGSTNVQLVSNYAGPGETGFKFHDSDGNRLFYNHAYGNVSNYSIGSSDDNTFESNYAEFGDGGFWFGDAHNNTIINNRADDTGPGAAFVLDGSTLNLVQANFTPVNGAQGFHVFLGAVNNLFVGNGAHLAADVGFRDSTVGSGTAGTGNAYVDNACLRNTNGPSSPVGLCDPSGTFDDDDGSAFELSIEWMAWEEITKGCNPPDNTNFCPSDNVTRGQMAAFLVRALGYADDGGGGLFSDTVGHTFGPAIDKLATAGVTKGCNPPANTNFCPDDFVTRGQMAAFLVRALGYTDDGGGDLFEDDDGHTFEGAIDKLGTAGVTRGCNPPLNTNFCPDDLVTRGQMAAFLRRALDS